MKNELYNKLIKNISKSIKTTLDETLTTHPLISMVNFLNILKKHNKLDFFIKDMEYETIDIEQPNKFDNVEIQIIAYKYVTGDLTKCLLEYID